MILYSLHVYNRRGQCLFDREWAGRKRPEEDIPEHRRLIFGMLTAVVETVGKMAPKNRAESGCLVMRTDAYAIHTYASLSGYRFAEDCVLTTDAAAPDQRKTLFHLYAELWVECVVKNPLCSPWDGTRVDCRYFEERLQKFVEHIGGVPKPA